MSIHARLKLTAIVATAAFAALLCSPPVAAADGLPAVGVDARPLSAPGSEIAYVTRRAGRRTALEVIDADSERRLRRVLLPGRLTVPAVAYDATPSGITPDGRKLVLIEPRRAFPRSDTGFAVIDTERLRIRRSVRLEGDFSFDALSLDGHTMYLIHYLSRRNILRYEVRAYDLRSGRLLPDPIVDSREPDERMSGQPVTRATGAGGRWEYTLYDGGEHPFVHALDTERRTAVCIDLEELEQVWNGRLDLRGTRLEVVGRTGRVRAAIDTRTHRFMSVPASQAEADAGTSWLPIAAPTAALLLLAAATGRRRRAARAP
jgi:hypothetical protein